MARTAVWSSSSQCGPHAAGKVARSPWTRRRLGSVLLHDLADPARLHRLGVEGLQAFTARRGVRLQRRKAEQLHQAAADALRLPAAERVCRTTVLAADLAVLDLLNNQIDQAEQHLAAVLQHAQLTN